MLLSSIGARLRPLPTIGATLAAREDLLRESGLDVTLLRPNTLMPNALAWADGIRDENRIVDPTGPGRMPCVDPDDIENLTGVAPRTFRDWCERHVDTFR